MRISALVVTLVPSLALAVACGGSQPPPAAAEPAASASEPAPAATAEPAAAAEPSAPAKPAEPKSLTVDIAAKSGSKVSGKVTVTEEAAGVRLVITLEGATPGDHGAHVHEKPDCGAPDGKSAGDHYNPDKHQHGLPDARERHIGDLGNIQVGKDGKGSLELSIAGANLTPDDPHSFLGRSLIIHEKKDDGGQPAGNAGSRIGCAVIVESK